MDGEFLDEKIRNEEEDKEGEGEGEGENEEEQVNDIVFTSSDNDDDNPLIGIFQKGIEKFRNHVHGIFLDVNGPIIKFSVESSLFPIALRAAFGFRDDNILNFEINLNNYDWTRQPITCNITNSNSTFYCGQSLVEKLKTTFFSPNYGPKTFYRCAPLFLRSSHDQDSKCQRDIENEGFSKSQAILSSSLCKNNFDQSILFLITGQYQLDESFKIILSYDECPLLYFILEVFEILINLQDHCAICGQSISPSLRARTCNKDDCKKKFYPTGFGTTLLKEMRKKNLICDLFFTTFSIARKSNYFYPPLPPIKNQEDPQNDIGPNLIDVLIKQIKSINNYVKENPIEFPNETNLKSILNWVILSCPTNLVYMPVKNVNYYKFLAFCASPEQESIFLQLKKKYRSKYLWFGAPTERWHSILRNGLANLNVAKLVPIGFLYDEGIYLSEKHSMAIEFARPFTKSTCTESEFNNLQIVALCEVVNLPSEEVSFDAVINGEISQTNPSTKKKVVGSLTKNDWCYTLTMSEACIVRYLFVNLQRQQKIQLPDFAHDVASIQLDKS